MRYKISLIAFLVASLLFSAVTFARSSVSRCKLINKTGYDIETLYICPAGSEDWELCSTDIDNGHSITVDFSRSSHFDIRCEYENGRTDMWYSLNLYDYDKIILLRNGKYDNGSGSHGSNPFKDYERGGGSHRDHDDDYYKPQF
ncbi:MAG: hypothetical protein IKZ58_02840 [Selenomonadaceae bacterium]|nr:hypothetical protein [Selenomonadaceae bacterium]